MRTTDTVRASTPKHALELIPYDAGDIYLLNSILIDPTPTMFVWQLRMEWVKIGNDKENKLDTAVRDKIVEILREEEDNLSDGYYWYANGGPDKTAKENQQLVTENLNRIAERILSSLIHLPEPQEEVDEEPKLTTEPLTEENLRKHLENTSLPPKTIIESNPSPRTPLQDLIEGIRSDVKEIRLCIQERDDQEKGNDHDKT